MWFRTSARPAAVLGLLCTQLVGCTIAGLDSASEDDDIALEDVDSILAYEEDLEPTEPTPEDQGDCLDEEQDGSGTVDPNADPTTGRLLSQRSDGTWIGLPLERTSFDSAVVGTVAETVVTQRFRNPLETHAEITYVFPLPNEAAVDGYWFRIGDRLIEGKISERVEAQRAYATAKNEGKTAALLQQERPNVFLQSLANIPPGEDVEVTIHIVQPLRQDDGRYELVFPTVVGPRYAFDQNPPVGGPAASAHKCGRLDISVALDAGVRIKDVRSRAHSVKAQYDDDQAFIELRKSETRLDRDFALSWSIEDQGSQAVLQLQPEADGMGYFTLSLHPPPLDSATIPPRELIFVVDTSGSMQGEPMQTAQATMHKFLNDMAPEDAFQVVRFSNNASSLGEGLLAATPQNIANGLDYVDAMEGGGGTEMTAGIRAALGMPGDAHRMRMVMFLTDGYIGNESDILALLEDQVGSARLFSLGIGSSVNRFLLDGMARVGRGAVTYVDNGESPDAVVDRFYEQIGHPAMTDVEIDWGAMQVVDVVPKQIPDLFVGRPVVAFGRYHGALPSRVKVRGRVGGESVELSAPVRVAARHGRADGIGSLWARNQIEELELSLLNEPSTRRRDRVNREILDLSLEHGVLTELTAFLAVDAGSGGIEVEQGNEITQAVDQVEGMAWETRSGYVPQPGSDDGLGLAGTGRGGGGTGQGSIGLGNTSLIGKGGGGGAGSQYGRRKGLIVRFARARVAGHLPAPIIKRIVRAHINEMRGCYNQALVRNPDATGRVLVRFVILGDGSVSVATIPETQIEDQQLTQCVTHAVRTWKFPPVETGGVSVVNYPFVFSVPGAEDLPTKDATMPP
jgi:Ca-activated chloride channel family protein